MADNDIVVRFAVRNDVDKIMKAINDHWDSSHILAHNRDFFHYVYGDNGNQINMVIGEEQCTGEIVGFLGFVKYNSNDCPDISLVLWKAVEGKDAILGIKLLFFLIKNVKHILISCVGVNPKTALPIYKSLKYNVGQLEHYYRISDREEYKIAKIVDKSILPIVDYGWDILRLPDFETFKTKIDNSILTEVHPHKDKNYFYHRFFAHPVYHYMVYAITAKDTDVIPAFFVCREIERFGARILRIIDYIGKELYFSYLALPLQKIMDENNYEYIDCYCCGMSEKTMNDAGLVLRKENDPNIIPNYFEPFLSQNINLFFFFYTK